MQSREPLVLQGLLHSDSLARIKLQHLLKKIDCLCTGIGEDAPEGWSLDTTHTSETVSK